MSHNEVTIEVMGGLGNQLFQIFTLISYAIKYNKKFYIENRKASNINRPFYWDNILQAMKPFIREPVNVPIYQERQFSYKELLNIKSKFKLYGYFQSHKYFYDKSETIIKMLGFNEMKKKIDFDPKNKVSLHFRIGDYINIQNCHPVQKISYYENCIKQLIKDTKKDNWEIIYFYEISDEKTIDKHINHLKNMFNNIVFTPVNHKLSDWEQMLTMSLCQHNIIANSTFSWWGAYLNNNDNIVYYPNTWFGETFKDKNVVDLFPIEWKKIH